VILVQFGEKLKELRDEKDLTQKQVADFIGVSERVYGYYEKDRFPKDEIVLKKLALLFNVSLDWLLGNSDIKEPAEKLLEKSKDNEYTIALHNINGYDEELPEEARKEIDNFIEYVRQKYGKKE
jgi:transcriptional regulator with XRE-family HTH domain